LQCSSSKEVSEAAQDSSSSDEDDVVELTSLKRVHKFLVERKAEGFHKEVEKMIELANQSSESDLDSPEQIGQSKEEDKAPPLDDTNKPTKFFEDTYQTLSRLFRPQTPFGFKRIEWRCASRSCSLIR
jgi:hypothetical protein